MTKRILSPPVSQEHCDGKAGANAPFGAIMVAYGKGYLMIDLVTTSQRSENCTTCPVISSEIAALEPATCPKPYAKKATAPARHRVSPHSNVAR